MKRLVIFSIVGICIFISVEANSRNLFDSLKELGEGLKKELSEIDSKKSPSDTVSTRSKNNGSSDQDNNILITTMISNMEGNWGLPGCVAPTTSIMILEKQSQNRFQLKIQKPEYVGDFLKTKNKKFGENTLFPTKLHASNTMEISDTKVVFDEKDSSIVIGVVVELKNIKNAKDTLSFIIPSGVNNLLIDTKTLTPVFKCKKQNELVEFRNKSVEQSNESMFSIKDFKLNEDLQNKCKINIYQFITFDNSLLEFCTTDTTVLEVPYRVLIFAVNGKMKEFYFINAKSVPVNSDEIFFTTGDKFIPDPLNYGNLLSSTLEKKLGNPTNTTKSKITFIESLGDNNFFNKTDCASVQDYAPSFALCQSQQSADRKNIERSLKEKCGECKLDQYGLVWKDNETDINAFISIPETKGSLGYFSKFAINYKNISTSELTRFIDGTSLKKLLEETNKLAQQISNNFNEQITSKKKADF